MSMCSAPWTRRKMLAEMAMLAGITLFHSEWFCHVLRSLHAVMRQNFLCKYSSGSNSFNSRRERLRKGLKKRSRLSVAPAIGKLN